MKHEQGHHVSQAARAIPAAPVVCAVIGGTPFPLRTPSRMLNHTGPTNSATVGHGPHVAGWLAGRVVIGNYEGHGKSSG